MNYHLPEPRFLVDTNTLSEPLRPRPDTGILLRLRTFSDVLATAAPVLHELRHGALRLPASRRRSHIERYINVSVRGAMPILAYDEGAAEWLAAERARLEAIGRPIPHIDGQIAAIAATNGLVLVTANTADFQPFHGLQLEDWRS